MVVLATALVIGPLVSAVNLSEYFSARGTWGYIVHNAGLYTLQHRLTGVFDNNPYPWSANGAIWTLPMELTGYLLVLGFGVAGLFRRTPWLTIVLMLTLIGLDRRLDASMGNPGHGGSFLQVPFGSLVSFLVAFTIGMVLHAYRDKIPLSPFVAWSLVGLQIAVHTTKAGALTLPVMAGYGALVLAFHWPARLEGYDSWVFGSYGLYVGISGPATADHGWRRHPMVADRDRAAADLPVRLAVLALYRSSDICRCDAICHAPSHVTAFGFPIPRIRTSALGADSRSYPSARS